MRLGAWLAPARELSAEFWRFFIAGLCFDVGFATYLFLYSLFLLDLGYNERQLGLVAGALTLGVMVGTLPVGAAAKRFGLKQVVLAGFIATPVICVVRPFLLGMHAQIALSFLTGLALCSWQVCFSPLTASLTSERVRTFAFSLVFSTGITTGALGALAGGWLPGWLQLAHLAATTADAKRLVLLASCGLFAAGIIPLVKLRLPAAKSQRQSAWRFDPFLYRYLPAMALWTMAAGAFVPFAQAFLSRQTHLSLPKIGEAFSAGQIAQVATILVAPIIFQRCGLVAGIAYTQAISGIALAALAGAHRPATAAALYTAFMAIHWMSGPGIYSLLMNRVAEEARSTASAANIFTSSLCQSIASAIAGSAYVRFGYPAVLLAISVIALVSSAAFVSLLRESPSRAFSADATAESWRDKEVTNTVQPDDNSHLRYE